MPHSDIAFQKPSTFKNQPFAYRTKTFRRRRTNCFRDRNKFAVKATCSANIGENFLEYRKEKLYIFHKMSTFVAKAKVSTSNALFCIEFRFGATNRRPFVAFDLFALDSNWLDIILGKIFHPMFILFSSLFVVCLHMTWFNVIIINYIEIKRRPYVIPPSTSKRFKSGGWASFCVIENV